MSPLQRRRSRRVGRRKDNLHKPARTDGVTTGLFLRAENSVAETPQEIQGSGRDGGNAVSIDEQLAARLARLGVTLESAERPPRRTMTRRARRMMARSRSRMRATPARDASRLPDTNTPG